MSRNIAPKHSISLTEEELEAQKTEKSRLLITDYRGKNCALLIQNDRLMEALFFSKEPGKVGAVYIGRVRNLVKNIDACFVEIGRDEICFLPLKNASSPWLLNRKYDGRLLEGDALLVQVVRDAQKGKRASVTAHISLANDYFVLSMGDRKTGYSTKLCKERKAAVRQLFRESGLFDLTQDKDCLVQNCEALLCGTDWQRRKAEGMRLDCLELPPTGLIIRTKAEEPESGEVLLQHFYSLSAMYIDLLYTALHRSCFSCLREADAGLAEAIFHQFPPASMENLEIITDQRDVYEQLLQYKKHSGEIRFYENSMLSLSGLYSVEKKLETALDRRVWLKSGAYLVIEPTEALTAIDVNSGKYESGKDANETYLKINLEAADEVAHQLRLRNLSGIIIVDFINMQLPEDRKALMDHLKKRVSEDKVPAKVVDMTALGLVEITRKKITPPLQEQLGNLHLAR